MLVTDKIVICTSDATYIDGVVHLHLHLWPESGVYRQITKNWRIRVVTKKCEKFGDETQKFGGSEKFEEKFGKSFLKCGEK